MAIRAHDRPHRGGRRERVLVGYDWVMSDPERRHELHVLGQQECLAILGGRHFGRLGFVADGWPVILPVNYVFDEPSIVVRTGTGAKLDESPLTMVAFEVDDVDPAGRWGWSVLAQGPPSTSPRRSTSTPACCATYRWSLRPLVTSRTG